MIPQILFEDPRQFIAELAVIGKDHLTTIWDKLPNALTQIEERLSNAGLDCKIIKNDKKLTIYLITLPKPIKITEAYYIAIIYRPERLAPIKQEGITRYITLELTGGDGNDAVLCEWTADDCHINHGKKLQPTAESFVHAIFDLIAKDFSENQETVASIDTEIDPANPETWHNKGNALNSLGKFEEALSCFDKALEINPNYAEAWNNKGLALGKLGRYQEALECYDKASMIK